MSRVSTVLNRAADEIEQRGKARTVLVNSRGNVCALGALRIASGAVLGKAFGDTVILSYRMNWQVYDEAYKLLDAYLLEKGFYKNYHQKDNGVAGWNDSNNKDSVVKVMREAANHANYVDALKLVAHNAK